MTGIAAFGAYIPRHRLQRAAIAGAHAWFAPGLRSLAKGERAIAGWDEDAVTMGVEAARDCLQGIDRAGIRKLVLASTSHPFADRQNAGIIKEALNLDDGVATLDVGGSQRAGTSALLDALHACAGSGEDTLCVAAAALVVSAVPGAAAFLGGVSRTTDFVGHFRSSAKEVDYGWESRWVRELGYGRIVPAAVADALAKLGIAAAAVNRFVMGAPLKGSHVAVATAGGIDAAAVGDPLADGVGDAGCAQPLLLLAHTLETAAAGDIILVVGFGQGCDVLLFRATGARAATGLGVTGWIERRKPDTNYLRYLVWSKHLGIDLGMRAEFDQKTALTALYRNRKAVLGLVGGRCTETGTVQFPKSEVGLAEGRRVVAPQEDYCFAERRARILTWTADSLTYTPDPPALYGTVDFDGGGRMTVEFADLDSEDAQVGMPMRMMFRIKAADEKRGFTKYFWKAAPDFRADLPSAPTEKE